MVNIFLIEQVMIGISVHEAPYIKAGNKQILERRMVFSVKPGARSQNIRSV